MRVYLAVLGCRLNQSETEQMAAQFAAVGYTLVDTPEQADLIVVNTCAVTSEAERKSRQVIYRAHRASPKAQIVVTGCYAELASRRLATLPGVVQVIGNSGKERVVALLAGHDIPAVPPSPFRRTRAFVKVQDGCDNHCTYCITTRLRGARRSRPVAEIVDAVRALVAQGVNEVVLTGVHLGAYGHDLGNGAHHPSLRQLIAAILAQTTIPRLRPSSLEPWDIAAELLSLWADPRLCPHLHLPLQSGCAATLRRMGRRITPDGFARLAESARARIADLAITTDVMVGFPGETDEEFEESYRFIRTIGLARLHIFRYSPRPGTVAARLPDQVTNSVKRERAARLHALDQRLRQTYAGQYVGRTMDVLWESEQQVSPEGPVWSGLTGNYLRVTTISPLPLYNAITPTRLVELRGTTLIGQHRDAPGSRPACPVETTDDRDRLLVSQ